MEPIEMKTAFSRCSIIVGSNNCPLLPILKDNSNFLMDNLLEERSRTICFHAGTYLLPIITSVIMGLYCYSSNQTIPEEIVKNLKPGAYVIFNGSRGIFTGFDVEGRAIVKQTEQASPLINYIPTSRFHLIKPYYGDATTLNGKGIRGILTQKQNFLSDLLDVDKSELPTELSNSIVIVMDRYTSDYIMRNTVLRAPSGNSISLGEVFPAAYYTDNDIYHYAGNVAKTDPIIKFTSKVSVARELVIDDEEKRILGIVVCSRNALESGESELMPLMGRRSLRHICLIDRINSWNASTLIERFPDVRIFAWTKPVMEQYIANSKGLIDASANIMSQKLVQMMRDICEGEVHTVSSGSPISIEQYISLRKALWNIAKFDYSDSGKERFVIVGFSLLKLFTYSIVSMRQFEQQITQGVVVARSPSDQLRELKSIAKEFVGVLLEQMTTVIDGLSAFYASIEYSNSKFDYLFNCLMESTSSDTFTIIIPKGLYGLAFMSCFIGKNKSILKRMRFVVSERFDVESNDGDIICPGAFSGKHFNPYNGIGKNTSVLIYDYEKTTLRNIAYMVKKNELLYGRRNFAEKLLPVKKFDELPLEEDFIDTELESYINQVLISSAISSAASSDSGIGQDTVPICRIALFESGQTAFLTKNYVAYSLDETAETVVEKDVADLQSGNYMIFKNFDDEAGDIVDELLQKLIASDDSSVRLSETYRISKRWKLVLKDYMHSKAFSYKDISREMANMGHRKHEATIRTWLNEELHIVGPRDEDSFVAVALITGDKDILGNPQKYWKACNVIRATRVRILRYVGLNIIGSMGHQRKNTDVLLASVIGDISEFASVLRIENIVEPSNVNMPMHLVNRLHYQ